MVLEKAEKPSLSVWQEIQRNEVGHAEIVLDGAIVLGDISTVEL